MVSFVDKSDKKLIEFGAGHHQDYMSAQPYPHIVFDDFFNREMLDTVLAQTPSLMRADGEVIRFSNRNEEKLASKGEQQFGETTKQFIRFLNSEPFLNFLENLTGITQLLPDPHFEGGGHHEILPGGFLKIHADFNRHGGTGLDRRLNVLVYLNKDWDESWGGHFELWDREMTHAVKKVLPIFNRMVVFSTTSITYHGHPEPLRCPTGRSRKSLALYYYTNGRPEEELRDSGKYHSTLFQARPNTSDASRLEAMRDRTKKVVKAVTPPVLMDLANLLRRR